MFYKYYGRWPGRGLSSGQSEIFPEWLSAATRQHWRQAASYHTIFREPGDAPTLNTQIFYILQLVVARLKDHHFSFDGFSNKLHMETTIEHSTGRGPSEELWSMSCQCAAVIISLSQFYFHHLDV